MGAGLGGALAGTALGTDRGRVVVVDTALLGRSHSSAGRRPREKDISPAPGARGVSRTPVVVDAFLDGSPEGGQKMRKRLPVVSEISVCPAWRNEDRFAAKLRKMTGAHWSRGPAFAAKGREGSRRRAATRKTRANAARLVRRLRTFAIRTPSANEATLSRAERRGGRGPRSPSRMSSLEPEGMPGKREALALESPREPRDATPAPATPPQNASMISRDMTSASFADLRQHIAKRGAPFTGRVRLDSPASASKPPEPSGAGGSPMKRVASTPSLQARASTPAPGSQGMRDMFFVRQDNINFNASYGTPVREVRPRSTATKTPRTRRPRPRKKKTREETRTTNVDARRRFRSSSKNLFVKLFPTTAFVRDEKKGLFFSPFSSHPNRSWRSSGRTTSSARRPRTSGCSVWRR